MQTFRMILPYSKTQWSMGMLLGTVLLCNQLFAQASPDSLMLFDFEAGFDLAAVQTQDAEVAILDDGGDRRLKINTGDASDNPGIVLKGPEGGWDLGGYHHVKLDITNAGDHLAHLVFKVGDPEDGMEAWQMEIRFDLEPGETKTILDDITTTPWVFSPPLEIVGLRAAPGQPKTDLRQIDQVKLSIEHAESNHELLIDNIRATNPVRYVDPDGFLPFIDKFGQYKHADWPGKTLSEDDLKQRKAEEARDLSTQPGPQNFGEYGGWKDGPQFEATGFFRPQKHAGVWWLVDPDGYLFWSHGVCCVNPGSATTGITDREAYYEDLPTKESDFVQFYGNAFGASHGYYKGKGRRDTYNFTGANLYRKYGRSWREEFNRVTHARLRSWGMNTLGIASDGSLCREKKTPYVETVWVRGTKKIEASSGYWGKFHDVFDPSFGKSIRRSLSNRQDSSNDPWCIGYFIENELSWGRDGSLSLATLASPASQVAKQVFVDDLKKKYTAIENLNTTWGTSHASWDALLQSQEKPDRVKAWDDLLAFYQKIAETYFSTVEKEMHAIAPNIMYLGCRLAWANSDIVTRTAAKYCDVLSYNKYEFSVENFSLTEGVDKPAIISEFHFGALDRGSFHIGIRGAFSQSQRGELYTNYVEGALRNPFIVGTHWFQYGDQSPTGRGDGENYNVGLVDICDNPFPELIEHVQSIGQGLYEYRLNAAKD